MELVEVEVIRFSGLARLQRRDCVQGGLPSALVTPPLGTAGVMTAAGQQRRTALAAGQRLLAAQAGVNQASTLSMFSKTQFFPKTVQKFLKISFA